MNEETNDMYNDNNQILNKAIRDMKTTIEIPIDDAFELIAELVEKRNIALFPTIPKKIQPRQNTCMIPDSCTENSFQQKSAKVIYSELEESRRYFEQGEYEDFDKALDDISNKFHLF